MKVLHIKIYNLENLLHGHQLNLIAVGVLKEYKTVVNEERQQYIVFAENKTISIPEIIITR